MQPNPDSLDVFVSNFSDGKSGTCVVELTESATLFGVNIPLGGCPRIKSGKLSDKEGNLDLAANSSVCPTSFFLIALIKFTYCRPVRKTGCLKTILLTELST